MISMLSQLSSTQDDQIAVQHVRQEWPKSGMLTALVTLGVTVGFALFVVTGVHGLIQAFGIA